MHTVSVSRDGENRRERAPSADTMVYCLTYNTRARTGRRWPCVDSEGSGRGGKADSRAMSVERGGESASRAFPRCGRLGGEQESHVRGRCSARSPQRTRAVQHGQGSHLTHQPESVKPRVLQNALRTERRWRWWVWNGEDVRWRWGGLGGKMDGDEEMGDGDGSLVCIWIYLESI